MQHYCRYARASLIDSFDDAIATCADAGEWAALCRDMVTTRWALHDPTLPFDHLLASCSSSGDCALELIEMRQQGDVAEQLRACERHTGPFLPDCTSQVINRWYAAGPDLENIERLGAWVGPAAPYVGQPLGVAVGCSGLGSCGTSPAIAPACQQTAARAKDGQELCRLD